MDAGFEQAREKPLVDVGHGRVRAHPTGVRPRVAVESPLEVTSRRERQRIEAVAEREHRHLGAFEQLLHEHGAAEAPGDLEAGNELLVRAAHHDTLARREAVGLEHAGCARRIEDGGRGHTGRSHDVLREELRPLDPRRRARRPEYRDPRVAQHVGDAGDERRLRADDDEVAGKRSREPQQPVAVVRGDRMARSEGGDSGVPRRGVQLGQLGRRREPPGERVLPTARPDEEDTHRPSLRA